MAKARSNFVCQNCGAVTPRWVGKCESCGEWNSIVEETAAQASVPATQRTSRKGRQIALEPLSGKSEEAPRIASGIKELDRVTGGGFVRGSAILLGGDPGIGKSTLLIEAVAALARKGKRVVYVSGEEAVDQVRMRAQPDLGDGFLARDVDDAVTFGRQRRRRLGQKRRFADAGIAADQKR